MNTVLQTLTTLLSAVVLGSFIGACALYFLWFFERNGDDGAIKLAGATPGTLNPLRGAISVILEALSFAVLVITYPLRIIHDVMPFRAQKNAQSTPKDAPILLVHGWGANSACMIVLQLWLKMRGYKNVYAISYTPPVIRAEKLSKQLAVHIDKALAATGAKKVNVIAHSMGGLLTRYSIKNLGADGKIDKVITLGSPHLGSKLAGIVPGGGNVPQMHYRSDFVNQLADGGLTPGKEVRYFSIYSEFDNFVLPNSSSVLDGNARNIQVPYHGHCALLYSPRVFSIIDQCLESGDSRHTGTA